MTRYSDDGDVRDIARALRRRKLLLLAIPVVFVAVGYRVAEAQDPVYEADAVVSVERPPPPVDGTNQAFLEGDRLVRAQRDFVESDAVQTDVTNRIGEHEPISTSSSEGRDVITITAEDGDAARAALVANTYTASYLDLRRASEAAEVASAIANLDQRLAEIDTKLAAVPPPSASGADPAGWQRNELFVQQADAEEARAALRLRASVAAVSGVGEVVEAAEAAESPARPDKTRYLAIALLSGLIIGIAAALVRDSLDRSVRLAGGELQDLAELPVLAVVPRAPWWRRLVPAGATRGANEAFRSLRAVLATSPADEPARVVQLVSPRHGRLAAETVAHVGEAFEQAGHRVLLISADLRHPQLPGLLGVPQQPGLVSMLLGQSSLQDSVRRVGDHENLLVLPPGVVDANAPDLLASQKLTVVLEQLRGYAEVVFVEAPPVLTAADSLELATEVDATVLVVTTGKTKIDDVQRALTVLGAVGSNVLGCVVYQTPGR